MRNIFFDISSLPLFLMILFVCHSRKMTRGSANQLFIGVVLLSLFSAIADLLMELCDNAVPLAEAGRMLCTVCAYIYLIFRNATNAVLLLFLLALTRTTHLIRSTRSKIIYSLPYACVLIMLVQNPFTHNAFTVTAEAGYARAPLMLAFYGIALIYGVVGLGYCIYCRRYLPPNKWGALMAIYILGYFSVMLQYFHPELLVEMFCTAIGEMLIMLTIMRPEERMDTEVGMLSWTSYQKDLKNIILSGEHAQIIVIRMQNSREMRSYLGEHEFNLCLSEISKGIRDIRWKHLNRVEVYCERPGTIYLLTDEDETGIEDIGERLLTEAGSRIGRYAEMGVRFEPQVCVIRCPEELQRAEDIISLGHKFQKIDGSGQAFLRASDVVRSRTFAIEVHIEAILDRAIKQHGIEMHYQPIYDVRSGSFRSAEALARINDPEFGPIPPSVFIPAAEAQGLIVPLGDAVLDQVFRFISEHDLDDLGLSYIEVNLSVAQCMESSLPEKLRTLQQKYGIDPGRINLEITETTFENISEIMVENVNKLTGMGYSFALDDYGTGYSSIQRVIHLPLKLVKIDKSLLDEVSSADGRKILGHTIRMMQSIGKELVAEGAETPEVVSLLEDMDCDHIQGYFFSRPLPAGEFIRFLRERNGSETAEEQG